MSRPSTAKRKNPAFAIRLWRGKQKIFQAIVLVSIIAVFFVNLTPAMAADSISGDIKGIGNFALAGAGYAVATVLGLIALALTTVIGLLITVVVAVLITVAQYNNIINVPTVIQGWVIIRDLCNMSFILILLIIAFATILRMENFSAKKMLPKLLLMAILINFSRTIFGLLIDFSQIVMLTFVNAFAAGGGWFIQAFNTNWLLSMRTHGQTWGDSAVQTWSTAVAIIAGVLAAIITLIILSVMLAVLVARIVMLWIYTIFSPLIFLGFAFTPLQKYTGKLWEDFTKQLVVGPVLAFFIWLALTTAQTSTDILSGKANVSGSEICAGVGAFFCEGRFQQFIIVIGLLMGGLMVAQSMGGAAGSIAGKGLDWAKGTIRGTGKGALMVGGWGARKIKSGKLSEIFAHREVTQERDAEGNLVDVVKWRGKGKIPGVSKGLGGLASALYGLELRPTRMVEGFREALKQKAHDEEGEATGASAVSLKKGGFGGLIKGLGVSRDLGQAIAGPGGFLWYKGFKQAFEATVLGGPGGRDKIQKEIEKKKAEEVVRRRATRVELREKEDQLAVEVPQMRQNLKDIEQNILNANRSGNHTEAARLSNVYMQETEKLNKVMADLTAMQRNVALDAAQEEQELKERSKYSKEIARLERMAQSRGPIQTFYADREHDKLLSEAKNTLGDNDNAEYLVDAFKNALRTGNKEVAQAIILHATSVGHLNEIINGYKSKRDVYDEKGNLLVRKGQALPAGGYGLKEVIRQALIEDLNIDEQTAYATQSEASTIAKAIKHTAMTESIGTRNGMLYQRNIEGPDGQQAIARGEARKVDAERYSRDYNRLAYGDEFDTPSGRIFRFSKLGLDTITENAGSIEEELGRKRFNKNAAMKFTDDAETLRAWAKKLHDEGMSYTVYDPKTGKATSKDYVELVRLLLDYGQDVANAQKQEASGGGSNIKDWQREILGQQKRPI